MQRECLRVNIDIPDYTRKYGGVAGGLVTETDTSLAEALAAAGQMKPSDIDGFQAADWEFLEPTLDHTEVIVADAGKPAEIRFTDGTSATLAPRIQTDEE